MPDGTARPADNTRTPPSSDDALRDLVKRLDRDATTVAARDPDLSRAVRQLATMAERPGRTEDPAFRTRVAYALLDMEKLSGPISSVPPALRDEMNKRAITAPGLENQRLQELMRLTPTMADQRLVREVRTLANAVAREGGDQNNQAVRDRVDVLENKIRLAPASPNPSSGRQSNGPERPANGPGENTKPPEPASNRRPRSPGDQSTSEGQRPGWNNNEPTGSNAQQTQAQTAAGNAGAIGQAAARGVNALDETLSRGAGVIAKTLATMARARQNENPNWDRQPTSVAERTDKAEGFFSRRRDEATIKGAEKSQRDALEAVQTFANGPASTILSKIQDAAKANPDGMQGVLAGMREGGAYAGLRAQFNAELVANRGMGEAWDKMSNSVKKYGNEREAVIAIGQKNNTAASLEGRFAKIDAEIGAATSIIPSRSDGKAFMDDIGEKVRAIIDKAVNAVKTVFSASADNNNRPPSGPGPSP